MSFPTTYRLAEEIMMLLSGGEIQAAKNVTIGEIKIAIGQVINSLLKVDYLSVNVKMGEAIPNGTAIATYDNIAVSQFKQRSKASLPIKPMKLPRNMGIFSVYRTLDPETEFIPLQMGQGNMLKSQPMINDLLGQVGYENFGDQLIFTKDLTLLFPSETISMRLAIMDISLYDDYDLLPILPEHELQVKQQVVQMFVGEGIADKLVDSTNKQQQNTPVREQQQS
jgi:hypothetical protein